MIGEALLGAVLALLGLHLTADGNHLDRIVGLGNVSQYRHEYPLALNFPVEDVASVDRDRGYRCHPGTLGLPAKECHFLLGEGKVDQALSRRFLPAGWNVVEGSVWRSTGSLSHSRPESINDVEHLYRPADIASGRLAAIANDAFDDGREGRIKPQLGAYDVKVGPHLSLTSFPGDGVGLQSYADGSGNAKEAQEREPASNLRPFSGFFRGVRSLPLGAQIVGVFILAGAAWWSFWRALRPFGLFKIGRGDILKATGYALLSMGLFGSFLATWLNIGA